MKLAFQLRKVLMLSRPCVGKSIRPGCAGFADRDLDVRELDALSPIMAIGQRWNIGAAASVIATGRARCASGGGIPGYRDGSRFRDRTVSAEHTLAPGRVLRRAAWPARVIRSPLDAERELIHKLADSGARTVVTINRSDLLPKALKLAEAGHADHVIVADASVWASSPGEHEPIDTRAIGLERLMAQAPMPSTWPAVSCEDIALLQFTGATTGVPKAAVLTHANLTAAVSSYHIWFGGQRPADTPPDRVLVVLPLFHIYGLTSVMLRHLASGNELLLRSRFEIEAVLRDIEVNRVTSFPGVPPCGSHWSTIRASSGVT
jgi:acyl-CoA synthetase (AMP-forming)/AMP-acid ligase II